MYCDPTCQKLHWFTHKKVCKKLQEQREKQEARSALMTDNQANGMSAVFRFNCFCVGCVRYNGNSPFGCNK